MDTLSYSTFQARLIPLNKVWPAIPSAEQFRPIVVVSPIVKWLESRFTVKIQDYLRHKIDRFQVGFSPGCNTLMNIQTLLDKIKNNKRVQNKCVVFIDFKSAYNTLRRVDLWKAVQKTGIFN